MARKSKNAATDTAPAASTSNRNGKARRQRTPKTQPTSTRDANATEAAAVINDGATPITGKLGVVARAVAAPDGAMLEELTGATGWQPHTVRAALTRLRQRGIDARLTTVGDRKAYRVAPSKA